MFMFQILYIHERFAINANQKRVHLQISDLKDLRTVRFQQSYQFDRLLVTPTELLTEGFNSLP